jgi:hypothetical protein
LDVAATGQALQGQAQATQGALAVTLNQTAAAAGQANTQTQTAVTGGLNQTQTAVTGSLAQTQTAVANSIGQTQTAVASAVGASATAQAQVASTAAAATQTASIVSITQTALAGLNITPTATATATPAAGMDQSIVFNQLGGVPVTARLPLRGDEYVRQDALLCFYRPVVRSIGMRPPLDLPEGPVTSAILGRAPLDLPMLPPAKPLAQAALSEVTISDVTLREGNSGLTTANFTVTLRVPSVFSPTTAFLTFQTLDGAAQAGQDYVAASGNLTINAGNTFGTVALRTISVPVVGDTLNEADENFFVRLTMPDTTGNPAVLVRDQGVGTILNDDTPPTPTFTATPSATATPTFTATPTATATSTPTPRAVPGGDVASCQPPTLSGVTYQQLPAVIEPPPVGPANSAPFHLLLASPAPNALVRDSIAVVNFQRNASEASVNVWYPGGEPSTYVLFALDERGEPVAVARRDAVDVPAVYQLNVRSVERPIRQLLIEARPSYAGDFGTNYRFAPNVPALLLRIDFRYTSAPR